MREKRKTMMIIRSEVPESNHSKALSSYSPLLSSLENKQTPSIMVDAITTDDSLCDDNNTESRSNSMGSTSKRVLAPGGRSDIMSDGRSYEWLKYIFLFFFIFLAGVSNWAVIAYTHDYVPRKPLPDLVFSLIDEQEWASIVGDICVAICIVFLAGLLVFHMHRGTILQRVVFCAGVLYSMRSVTLAVTQLPSPYKNNSVRCRGQVSSEFGIFANRLFEQTIRIGFQSKDSMLCGDLLFSGHTLVMVTCSLAVAYYLPRSIKPLQWIAHSSCLIGMICMIVSRTHYTIDVVIAYWLSNFVFRFYHAYCEVDMCMERRKSILFSWWPCKLIDWLEENIVPGRIENRFSLPWAANDSDGNNVSASSESSTNDSRQHHKHVSISSSSTYPLPC